MLEIRALEFAYEPAATRMHFELEVARTGLGPAEVVRQGGVAARHEEGIDGEALHLGEVDSDLLQGAGFGGRGKRVPQVRQAKARKVFISIIKS